MEKAQLNNSTFGFVAIGRNEGQRLEACLNAIVNLYPDSPFVYVDSGSTDHSVDFARGVGAVVVELDMSVPFTAARARNAGFSALLEHHPDLDYVQFFDGDCEMEAGWIEAALSPFIEDERVGITSGRRTEKFPENSIYNLLMDVEWDTPIGETDAVLGDMFVKTAVFKSAGGFDDKIIAAEDDEFCIRVKKQGYKVIRVDAKMSRHDANITAFSQWMRRAKRAGHGYANLNHLYGAELGYFKKEVKRSLFWGACLPALAVASLLLVPVIFVAILAFVLVMCLRTAKNLARSTQLNIKQSFTYSCLLYASKVYEFQGLIQYWVTKLLSRNHKLIEYK